MFSHKVSDRCFRIHQCTCHKTWSSIIPQKNHHWHLWQKSRSLPTCGFFMGHRWPFIAVYIGLKLKRREKTITYWIQLHVVYVLYVYGEVHDVHSVVWFGLRIWVIPRLTDSHIANMKLRVVLFWASAFLTHMYTHYYRHARVFNILLPSLVCLVVWYR